jgi:predicted membrane protein
VAMLPLLLHLQQPLRGINVLMTPHFTSAISAFGIVFLTYACIVASELWFVYRAYIVTSIHTLSANRNRRAGETLLLGIYKIICLGAYDMSEEALAADHKATKILAAIGIPVACFLHGYAGFIFGSVKANALWMTPLMPVIFIVSAIVSGIALCILCYIITMELRKRFARRRGAGPVSSGVTSEQLRTVEDYEVKMTSRYLLMFMLLAITLELLDIIFRGYTAVKSWDIIREIIYQRDFFKIFVLQYTIGNAIPFIMLLLPGVTARRAAIASVLVLFGVFMMRWNVVIGGQAFSLTFMGFMDYHMPIIPTNMETFKEGLGGALFVGIVPFILFYYLNKIFPAFLEEKAH